MTTRTFSATPANRNPTQRAIDLGVAMTNSIGWTLITTSDIESISDDAVSFVNDYLGDGEERTSIDEVTPKLGGLFGFYDWE